jgi:hypothetical protein
MNVLKSFALKKSFALYSKVALGIAESFAGKRSHFYFFSSSNGERENKF